MAEDKRTLDERVSDIDQQVKDVTDYFCSRGDTFHMRDEIADRTRRTLHALSLTGWTIAKTPQTHKEQD